MGPALPGGESLDVAPVFADGGQHRVEEVDGVAAAELVVRVALVGDCPGVAVDGGAGSSPGALEVVLGAFELLLGGVDVAAQGTALPARGGVESMLCGAMTPACFDRSGLGVVEGLSIGGGCCGHFRKNNVGAHCRSGCLSSPR